MCGDSVCTLAVHMRGGYTVYVRPRTQAVFVLSRSHSDSLQYTQESLRGVSHVVLATLMFCLSAWFFCSVSTIAALVDSSQVHCPTRMDGEQAPCPSSLVSGVASATWPGGIFAEAAGPFNRLGVAPLSPQLPWSCAPDSFPDTPLAGFDSRHFFSKLDLDTLFFIFYYQQVSTSPCMYLCK